MIGVAAAFRSDLETNALYKPTNADIFYLYGNDDEFYPLGKFQSFEQKLKDYLPNFQSKLYKAKQRNI